MEDQWDTTINDEIDNQEIDENEETVETPQWDDTENNQWTDVNEAENADWTATNEEEWVSPPPDPTPIETYVPAPSPAVATPDDPFVSRTNSSFMPLITMVINLPI